MGSEVAQNPPPSETPARMWTDVVDLRDFYASPLGQTARRLIARRLAEIWPDAAGQSVLGLGYAVPYLRDYRKSAVRCLAMMPAAQGVLHWPPEGPNAAALVEEEALEFTRTQARVVKPDEQALRGYPLQEKTHAFVGLESCGQDCFDTPGANFQLTKFDVARHQ